MHISRVDPRDVRWEAEPSAFRAYLWSRSVATDGEADTRQQAWRCDEWRITDVADVSELLGWVRGQKAHQVVVYAETTNDAGEIGLIRLQGEDPTASLLQHQKEP